MKAYLLVFDDTQVVRKVITGKLDKLPEVQNWLAFLNNMICLVSDQPARALSRLLREAFPELRFIVVEIDRGKKGGFLPRSVWEFIDDPSPAESSAA